MGPEKIAVDRWLEHIEVLAGQIGPRGSTREGERRGHDYVERELGELGLVPVREEFWAARSIFLPHLVAGLAMLVAFVIYPLAGRVSAVMAAAVSLAAMVSELLQLSVRTNPLERALPRGRSQNVFATIEPAGQHLRDVVMIGHVDTQRTPLIFRSMGWVRAYVVFSFVAMLAFLVQVTLHVIGAVTQWSWIWPATIPCAVVMVLLVAMCIEADLSPFTPGANDNASAVGLVLELARRYVEAPLQHTRVWAVATGCEEVGHHGMLDFYRRHRGELRDPVALPFEMVGVDGPAYQTLEGVVVLFRADARLVTRCTELANVHPEWGAYQLKVTGGNTEMADAMKYGVPSVAITGVSQSLVAPYWHQRDDTPDKMNPEVMGRTLAMVTTLIEDLDRRGLS